MAILYSVREIAGFRHRHIAGDTTETIIFKSRFHLNRVAVVRTDKNYYEIFAEWLDDNGQWQRESYPRAMLHATYPKALKQGREVLKRILLLTGEWNA